MKQCSLSVPAGLSAASSSPRAADTTSNAASAASPPAIVASMKSWWPGASSGDPGGPLTQQTNRTARQFQQRVPQRHRHPPGTLWNSVPDDAPPPPHCPIGTRSRTTSSPALPRFSPHRELPAGRPVCSAPAGGPSASISRGPRDPPPTPSSRGEIPARCQNRGDATQGAEGGGKEMSTKESRGDFGETAGTGEFAGVEGTGELAGVTDFPGTAGIAESLRASDLCASTLRRPASWLERTMSSGDGVWKSKCLPSTWRTRENTTGKQVLRYADRLLLMLRWRQNHRRRLLTDHRRQCVCLTQIHSTHSSEAYSSTS